MPEKYFDKFQLVEYANNIAVNITQRVKFIDSVMNNPYVYYKYDIKENQRPDHIADFYYNDEYADWLLYLSNKIVDPYYEWYMSEEQFNSYLKKKYGPNIYSLQSKIYNYRNNWYKDDRISVAAYEALEAGPKRYWQPYYNQVNGNVVSYFRNRSDWIINTNAVVKYECDGSNFIDNERVTIYFNPTHVGKGQVSYANSSALLIQHVSGTLYSNNTVTINPSISYISGEESGANVVFTSSESIANNIPVGEEDYWDAITIYDHERQMNESKKSIQVLDRTYFKQVSKEMKDLLK